MPRRRRTGAQVAGIVATAAMLLGCAEGPSPEEALAVTEVLVDDLVLDVADAPAINRSKSKEYVTSTGQVAGDQEEVVSHIQRSLGSAGWVLESVETPDSAGRPSTEATVMRARRDDMVASIGVYDRLGSQLPPVGSRWVQVAVAHEDAGLGWTEDSRELQDR